ncbi:hypothetical protein ACN6LC_004708 [Streptomyces violaceoruber]|uniref:hypothetical protein n=1 Tax=Streptomyces violaceoruber TaxID=1935 RepID=UPI00403C9BEB
MIHIELGEESEWPGVRELAQRQTERYGLRFHVLRAEGGLLGLVEKRGMWADSAHRRLEFPRAAALLDADGDPDRIRLVPKMAAAHTVMEARQRRRLRLVIIAV